LPADLHLKLPGYSCSSITTAGSFRLTHGAMEKVIQLSLRLSLRLTDLNLNGLVSAAFLALMA